MVIKGFKLTLESLPELLKQIMPELKTSNLRVDVKIWKDARSIPLNSFQHVIYGELSRYLIKRGRGDFTPEYAKMTLKNWFLGWEDMEVTDLSNGKPKIVSVLRETSKLDRGEAHRYTEQIIEWCESVGLTIKIPINSDYFKFCNEQNH